MRKRRGKRSRKTLIGIYKGKLHITGNIIAPIKFRWHALDGRRDDLR